MDIYPIEALALQPLFFFLALRNYNLLEMHPNPNLFKYIFLTINFYLGLLNININIDAVKPITSARKVGKFALSPIGCGTWSWGNRFLWGYNKEEDTELSKTFEYLISNGVNWFDTADSYGTSDLNGRSEELLGSFSKKYDKKAKNVVIASKLAPYPWRIGKNSMIKACEESIKRLERPIDILQLHWPPYLNWQEKEYFSAFGDLLKNNQAKQIGLSNYGPIGLNKAIKSLKLYNCEVLSNQVVVN